MHDNHELVVMDVQSLPVLRTNGAGVSAGSALIQTSPGWTPQDAIGPGL